MPDPTEVFTLMPEPSVEEQISDLNNAKLPPTEENIQKYKDTLRKCPKLLQIMDNLNIMVWSIEYMFDDIDHTPDEPNCKICGFSKCRRRFLISKDFRITIEFFSNASIFSIRHFESHTSAIANWRLSPKVITKTKNVIFSINKYNNSNFIDRWTFSHLHYNYTQHLKFPNDEQYKKRIVEYKDRHLDFVYCKDVDEPVDTQIGDVIIDTIEESVSPATYIQSLSYQYPEFLQKEDNIFSFLQNYRACL